MIDEQGLRNQSGNEHFEDVSGARVSRGLIWIRSNISTNSINSGTCAGFGNNMMLAADPATREIRRFLIGPNQCEVTGVFVTKDQRTMVLGIQHPGERPDDPPGGPANPRQFGS